MEQTYLSGDCQREAVYKDHVVWDLKVRNLVEESKYLRTKPTMFADVFLFRASYVTCPHLAFTESLNLLCTRGLAVLQTDTGAHLLAQPLIFHSNHLQNKQGRCCCLQFPDYVKFTLAMFSNDSPNCLWTPRYEQVHPLLLFACSTFQKVCTKTYSSGSPPFVMSQRVPLPS